MSARIVFFLAACCTAVAVRAPAAEPRPNVLFIAVDDLNDWVGCYGGHPQARTPNIDRLAERGVLFTSAYCAAPVCLASRTALLCGRHPQATGVYSNWGETQGTPPPKAWQLPVQLAAAGYETLGAGKLYHGEKSPLFDEYFSTEQRWSPFTNEQAQYTKAELPSKGTTHPQHVVKQGPGGRDWVLPLNGLPSERNADKYAGESFDWGPLDAPDDQWGDTKITTWGVEKLAAAHDKPFFLGVGYYRPHIPLFAPKQDFDALPPLAEIKLPQVESSDLSDLGPTARKWALDPITAGTHELVVKHDQWREAIRGYLACITFVDRQIGRLVAALEASPHADNTWIILWSDHGWHLGEKEHWGKWAGWRQATRVPLVIVAPRSRMWPQGGKCAEPVSLVDLYPTLVDICGLAPQAGLHGTSLLPLLKKPDRATERAVLTTFDPNNCALTTRDRRYIRYADGEEELYDLANDPHEWRNLVADPGQQKSLAAMRARLAEELRNAAPR